MAINNTRETCLTGVFGNDGKCYGFRKTLPEAEALKAKLDLSAANNVHDAAPVLSLQPMITRKPVLWWDGSFRETDKQGKTKLSERREIRLLQPTHARRSGV